ncbi:MAG TPA: hypothetical protein VGN72_07985 [Tepidisphaeraceae bacterium]|jgi:hypothetical protein|nr:hypothetical protein [Tepidisphaeraceae bacterium]
MTQHDHANSPPDQAGSPFDQIINDDGAIDAAAEWSREQLLAGRVAEEIVGDLVAQGWDEDEASGLVEEVRKLTRDERGVVTRDTVAAIANREYRRGSGGWSVGFPTIAAARRLFHAMASLRWLRHFGSRRR